MTKSEIIAAVVTPVDKDGNIGIERLCRHARWLLQLGCHSLGVFGSTSEANSFSLNTRRGTLEALLESGLPADRMIVGVGTCARDDTLDLAGHAISHGVRRLIILPPFFYKGVPEEGLFRAFAEVLDRLSGRPDAHRLSVYLYHFPQLSGVPIPLSVISRLREAFPLLLRGIKDSSGDWTFTETLIRAFPELAILSGSDLHLLRNLEAGGAGTFSGAANIACSASRDVLERHRAGEIERANEAMRLVHDVRTSLQRYPLIPAIKYVIAAGQNDDVWTSVRPPLVPLDRESGTELLRQLEVDGFVYGAEPCSVADA